MSPYNLVQAFNLPQWNLENFLRYHLWKNIFHQLFIPLLPFIINKVKYH